MDLIPCPWCGLPTTSRDNTDPTAWRCGECGTAGHEVTIDTVEYTAGAAGAHHLAA